VFHHDPEHDDAMLDGIQRKVEAELPGAIVAREGLTLEP
jgi:ribonuclease Z